MSTVNSRDGTAIGYEKQGSGPPIILVCGATQYRAVDPKLAELATLLADRFTVVSYDRRGKGESGDNQPYAVEREIEDIGAIIEAVGTPASLVGFSSGAVLALEASKTLPVRKVVAYEPPFVTDDRRSFPSDYIDRLRLFHAARDGEGAFEYFLTAAIGMPAEHVAAMKHGPMWQTFAAIGTTIRYDAEIMGDNARNVPPSKASWAAVKVPVLVVDGDASFDFMAGAANAIAAVLPQAHRETLKDQDHGPQPEAFAPTIRKFLSH